MTLVVAILSEDGVFMISDTVLSSDIPLSNRVSHPTHDDSHAKNARYLVGLSQKIVVLAQNLFIGWSGDYYVAAKYIDYLRFSLGSGKATFDQISSAQLDYYKLNKYDFQIMSTLIFYQIEDEVYLLPSGNVIVEELNGFGKAYVIGSGANDFLSYVDAVPLFKPLYKEGTPQEAYKIEYILRYIILTMNHQHETGFGLDKGWGSGFEVIMRKEGPLFVKLDRILYHSCFFWKEQEKILTSRFGKRYFQYYFGEDLAIISQDAKKKAQLHLASPPDRPLKSGEQPLIVQVRSPQIVCTHLVDSENNPRIFIEYNEHGHPHCGIAPLGDLGESIRINTDWLKQFIASNLFEQH